MRRSILAGSLGFALGLISGTARAGDAAWLETPRPVAVSSVPAAALGRPVPAPAALEPTTARPRVIVRAQAPEPPPVPPPIPFAPQAPMTPSERYNCGVVNKRQPDYVPGSGGGGSWLDAPRRWLQYIPGVGDQGDHCFQSDHAFDGFISPVTNPFLFEDPRALTEARPLFLYQSIPTKNFLTRGGNVEFFGTQLRLALCERFSVVINKLGGVAIQPRDKTFIDDTDGLAEFWISPKWTFLRNENSGTLGALGVVFELPVGPRRVFQDTGDLSLTPYVSLGQNFFRTSYGSMNFLGTLGYSFAVDNVRSDRFFTSLHLDFDIANAHRFYPLIELNWFQYTANGGATNFGVEGRDLANFGSMSVTGNSSVALAGGLRVKINEHFQLGAAAEFPVTGRKDLMDYRLTFDMIFRY